VPCGADAASLIKLLNFFRNDYGNACNIIDGDSVSDSPVKTVEESYSHNNSRRCSDDEDNNAGCDDIDHENCENEDDVIEDIEDDEEDSDYLAPLLANSHAVDCEGESNLSTESPTRPKSR